MKFLLRLAGALALVSSSAALAQTVTPPVEARGTFIPPAGIAYKNDTTGQTILVSTANPLPVTGGGGGGGGDPTSTATVGSTTAPTRVTMQGLFDGSVVRAAASDAAGRAIVSVANAEFGANCTVVSGDQAYTVGSVQRCNLTSTGRVKVGLSSAGNITPAAKLATTTTADLTACQYLASIPAWSDTWTGSLTCNASGALRVEALGKQESFKLVNANTPTAAVTVAGGDYILSQTCSAYGTVNFQVRGPDGATYQTALSKTSSDTTGGTGLALGSFAVVQMTVSGTTGCNAILARVPA